MEKVNCIFCNKDETRKLFQVSDWLLENPENKSTLVQCTNCGLIYQNPQPSEDEINQLYPPDYELFQVEKKENKNWLMKSVMQYGMDKRCRIVTREKSTGKLLDIGCATGKFLDAMRRNEDWVVKGVELSDYAASIAREKGLAVFSGTLESVMFHDSEFDVVTLWDVLEHLPNPLKSLQEIHRILKPNGKIVFRVPNANSYDAKLFGSYWAGFEPPRHLYIFTPDTLNCLLTKSGFEITRMSCEIGSYPTFVLSVIFWMRGHAFTPKVINCISGALYSLFARALTVPFFYIISLLRKGSLLTVVARKVEHA